MKKSRVTGLGARAESLLLEHLVPFWQRYSVDRERGGFYGLIDTDGRVDPLSPRGLVMTARHLWSWSALYNSFPREEYRELAEHALNALRTGFHDTVHGGYFWTLSPDGEVLADHKQCYGQAFVLYALSEFAVFGADTLLQQEMADLFGLLEGPMKDLTHGGYWDACSRDWKPLLSHALSPRDVACAKSMNTHLHMLEAYTNYLRLEPGNAQRAALVAGLIDLHFNRILDQGSGHLSLYFREDWTRMDAIHSYGHDIEASWLLWEAAELLESSELRSRVRKDVLSLFQASMEGMDGSAMINELNKGHRDTSLIWWVQAEALVGLVNAWQLSSDPGHLDVAVSIMEHLETRQLSPLGELHWAVDADGRVLQGGYLGGEWKTPYHSFRACLELVRRSAKSAHEQGDQA